MVQSESIYQFNQSIGWDVYEWETGYLPQGLNCFQCDECDESEKPFNFIQSLPVIDTRVPMYWLSRWAEDEFVRSVKRTCQTATTLLKHTLHLKEHLLEMYTGVPQEVPQGKPPNLTATAHPTQTVCSYASLIRKRSYNSVAAPQLFQITVQWLKPLKFDFEQSIIASH